MTATQIDRRKALGVFAAVPVATALSATALAGVGDSELRELWQSYKQQLKRRDEAYGIFSAAEGAYIDALKILPVDVKQAKRHSLKRRFRVFKHERALDREDDRVLELACAISEATAETVHGLAIKLAVWCHEYRDFAHRAEHVETAYRDLAKMSGYNPLAEIEGALV